MNIYLYYSGHIPATLAESLAQATREEIARAAQNGVKGGCIQNMAEFLEDLEGRIHEAKEEDNAASAE